jgi:hypothetical protein
MKRLLIGGLVALGLAVTAAPASADCYFDYSCCRHFCYVHTCKNRCLTFSSYCNPLPCAPGCGGYGAPALWNSLAAYGHSNPSGYAVAAQPAAAAAAPAAAQPSFKAPTPSPATNGVKQTTYSYGQTPTSPSYGYSPSTGYQYYGAGSGYDYYGYGASYSYAQAPNYWY